MNVGPMSMGWLPPDSWWVARSTDGRSTSQSCQSASKVPLQRASRRQRQLPLPSRAMPPPAPLWRKPPLMSWLPRRSCLGRKSLGTSTAASRTRIQTGPQGGLSLATSFNIMLRRLVQRPRLHSLRLLSTCPCCKSVSGCPFMDVLPVFQMRTTMFTMRLSVKIGARGLVCHVGSSSSRWSCGRYGAQPRRSLAAASTLPG
mmetsp:Transcript_125037/g.233905  ORF Transcript_125037/g.233905 Transcript_125037/m.233905 type:complete len:201 (+) Transcript_125037:288-890(+)